MTSQTYCDIDICAEYASIKINNTNLCQECFLDSLKTIQSTIKMKHIKTLYKNSNLISTSSYYNNNLVKHLIKSGIDNETPKSNHIISFIFRAFLSNGTQINSSNSKPVEFKLNTNNTKSLWNNILKIMNKGEESIIFVDSTLYKSSSDFFNISNSSFICFYIKLLNFEDNIFNISNMSYEDKISNMNHYKSIATDFFKKNDITNSIINYHKALDFINNQEIDCPSKNDKINLLNNLSLCYYKIKKYNESSSFSFQVLELDENNIKGTYRHIHNLIELNQLENAIQGCHKLLELDSNEYNKQLLETTKINYYKSQKLQKSFSQKILS